MKKKLIVLTGSVMTLAPLAVAFAAPLTGQTPRVCVTGTITTIQGVLCKIGEILGAILPILIALGVVYFVWGVITYVISSDEEAKKTGRNRMIWGLVGLVVIIGMWGLVKIVTNTFGIDNVQQITLPTVPY